MARRSIRLTASPQLATRQRRLPSTNPVAAIPPLSRTRVLGLDPGSRSTGYALIDCVGTTSTYLASGAIHTEGGSFPERLREIFAGVAKLVHEFHPGEVAIERVFMHRNPDSAIKLGQARGAALCGTFAAAEPTIHEYAPREIKLAVVGTGAAQKGQVELMVKQLLRLTGKLGPDAADALAVALCHANARRMQHLLQVAGTPGARVRR